MVVVHWTQLATVSELKPFFDGNFAGFQGEIEDRMAQLGELCDQELQAIAHLRVLDVTNGIIQWAFRAKRDPHLPLEITRRCMEVSMAVMKTQRLVFPDGEALHLTPKIKALMTENRSLYIQGFKHHKPQIQGQFHAYSAAQFLTMGQGRLDQAIAHIGHHYGELFTPYFLERGRRYIQAYVDCRGD